MHITCLHAHVAARGLQARKDHQKIVAMVAASHLLQLDTLQAAIVSSAVVSGGIVSRATVSRARHVITGEGPTLSPLRQALCAQLHSPRR